MQNSIKSIGLDTMFLDTFGISPKKSIELLFAEKGFKVVCTKPMWFDAFYVSMLSEKYKGRKFSFLRGLCIGFLSNLFRMPIPESFLR